MTRRAGGVVWRNVSSERDLTELCRALPGRYPHLLESAAYGTAHGRHDILFAFPGVSLILDTEGRLSGDDAALGVRDFLSAFDAAWRREARPYQDAPDLPPFRGGWFLFLTYELVAEIEAKLAGVVHTPELPRAIATRVPAAIVRDRLTNETCVVCEAEQAELLDALEDDLVGLPASDTSDDVSIDTCGEESPEVFLSAVHRIKEYIAAGDVFQVNLSRRWQIRLARDLDAVALYRRLRAANPAPFAALASLPGAHVVSSSPERLVSVRGADIRTRPIAGTYPRSADPVEDRRFAKELLGHPKERAEHVMLIDLERNDLGRLCRPGTMAVSELMGLETYRHVHHIVSEVRGELRAGTTPADVIRAVFPGGTITGCPKVRCMEIIAELEQSARGAYTGSLGYVNRDGSLDLNILIRTLVQRGRDVSLRAGAGIVADSIPERELAETRAKAKGLLAALGMGA